MGCKVLMISGDLENKSRPTKFHGVIALLKVNLDMKYDCPAIKNPDCIPIMER